MNKPDESTLNRWLNGELEGKELEQVEAWAESHADDFDKDFQCSIGWEALRGGLVKSLPKSEEPPYPEFFNHKIEQTILAELEQQASKEDHHEERSFWKRFRWAFMPAAFAGMAVCFYAGTKMSDSATNVRDAVASSNVQEVYIPQSGVVAKVSESSGSTEIILDGLAPIPDSLDIAAGETSIGESPMMMTKAQRDAKQAIFY